MSRTTTHGVLNALETHVAASLMRGQSPLHEVAAALSKEYKNSNTNLCWQCSFGHIWEATFHNVKHGQTWCPKCREGRGEANVRAIFETVFQGKRVLHCRPPFLRTETGCRLELDGYCAQVGVAFEHNGGQHYEANHFWNRVRDAAFEQQVQRDQLKMTLCHAHGVRLIVVPYMVNDGWTFICTWLLKWFHVNDLFLTALPSTAGSSCSL